MSKQIPVLRRDDLENLIDALYASAAGEVPWAATLERLARAFAATGAVLNVWTGSPPSTLSFATFGGREIPLADYYRSDMFLRDPRHPHLMRVAPGIVYHDQMMYDVSEMERDPIYRDNVAYQGVKYSLGAKVALPHQTTATLAILTNGQQGQASVAAIDAMERLLPHLDRALRVGFMIEADKLTRDALIEALSHKADGVLLLDDACAPTFMNDRANEILTAGDGLSHSRAGFATSRLPETARLHSLIKDTCARALAPGAGGRMLVHRPSRRLPYVVYLAPAPRTERFLTVRRIAAVMHIVDLAASAIVSKSAVCQTFGLSDREGDLAVELARIGDLATAAAAAHMALNTARNHLHSIFLKTGVNGRADLVHVLSKLH